MESADFDAEFARLKAGATALAAAVASDPELAERFKAVMAAAVPDAQAAEQQALEVARANAVRALNEQVLATLTAGPPPPAEPEPEPEPEGDPEGGEAGG